MSRVSTIVVPAKQRLWLRARRSLTVLSSLGVGSLVPDETLATTHISQKRDKGGSMHVEGSVPLKSNAAASQSKEILMTDGPSPTPPSGGPLPSISAPRHVQLSTAAVHECSRPSLLKRPSGHKALFQFPGQISNLRWSLQFDAVGTDEVARFGALQDEEQPVGELVHRR